jgi:hypothetical protein
MGRKTAKKAPQTGRTDRPDAPNARGGKNKAKAGRPDEVGGPKGLEPTRFGDWEKDGRCTDF